ncbi:acireductone synthase [Celerinatantimonas yamalensis]|uniref:Enolase-phosphatase E1 n=1 Tax=Celerinatantimonas yamalensis TaxID=559956 RepID=A0ABW9G845_9GAMM
MIRAIVTDIEGTTTDIQFVHQVLFPYARERLAEFINAQQHRSEVRAAIDGVRQEIDQSEASLSQVTDALLEFMDEDLKSTSLKALQGMIWRYGYENGDFTGHLYADVLPAFKRWRAQNIPLYIYSSGSIAAQKLLFGYSNEGDLTPFLSGYFDTHVGHKRQTGSYIEIAKQIDLPAEQLLFLSDIHQELDAAKAAGWQTLQLIRGEADAQSQHPQVSDFSQI